MTPRMTSPVSHVTCSHGHWCVGGMGGRTFPPALLSTAVDYRRMSCDPDHVPAMCVKLWDMHMHSLIHNFMETDNRTKKCNSISWHKASLVQ